MDVDRLPAPDRWQAATTAVFVVLGLLLVLTIFIPGHIGAAFFAALVTVTGYGVVHAIGVARVAKAMWRAELNKPARVAGMAVVLTASGLVYVVGFFLIMGLFVLPVFG